VTHSQALSSTDQAQTILRAFSRGELNLLRSELEQTTRVHCQSADEAEQERWELLVGIAGQLHSADCKADEETCWSLLRHLAGTKAPRIAVAAA
jgi:hypothetical protein